ncbi:MAG: hypothetical protein JXA60_10425 [Candidatus Coatesbacteria bacterium]|nr:hypothetical protein [Candidatus Coatesbacteria bacterium]
MGKFALLNSQLNENGVRFNALIEEEFKKAGNLINEYINDFKDPLWIYYVWYTGKGANLQTASITLLELPQEAKTEYKIEKLLKWKMKPEQDLLVIQILNKDLDFDEQYCICKASDLVRLEKSKDIKFLEFVDEPLFKKLLISEEHPELSQKIQALKNRNLADHVTKLLMDNQPEIVRTILSSLKEDAFDENLLDSDSDFAEVLGDS